MWKTHCSLHHHPRRGRACPARALFHNHPLLLCHPVSPHTVGRGLDPSAGRRGRRPLQRWPEIIPHPRTFRPAPAHPSATPLGPGMPGPQPPRHLPSIFHRSPIPPNHLTPQPSCCPHPHNLCPPTAVTPIYTLPKLLPQTLSKKSKNLQKPVDKGHTTCYNNQAVSRAKPAAAAAGAFTYSLYAVF